MFLGIEIGGTKLQLGVGTGDGTLHALWRGAVDSAAGGDGIRRQIQTAVPETLATAGLTRADLRGVGVGFGGPTDDATQRVIKSHHVVGWDDFPLAAWVSDLTDLPAVICNDADVAALAEAGTVATLLPGVEFSTKHPYPSGRRLLDAGVTVALASDCNPGSCYTSSLPFCIALAVREMGMSPAEAVWAATAGGAAALDRGDVGRITVGARGDLIVLDAPTYIHLAYRPGVPLVSRVYAGGRESRSWSQIG